jgi:hypothetical protein
VAFDEPLEAGGPRVDQLGDALDPPFQGPEQLLLGGEAPPVEPEQIGVRLPAFPADLPVLLVPARQGKTYVSWW